MFTCDITVPIPFFLHDILPSESDPDNTMTDDRKSVKNRACAVRFMNRG